MDIRVIARGFDGLEFCVGEGWDAGKIGWVLYQSAALRKISLMNEYNKPGIQSFSVSQNNELPNRESI